MNKLTFLKTEKLKIKDTGIIVEQEKVMGEITAQADIIQDVMSNQLIVEFFQEIGATHWELTEVPNTVKLEELPDNFYNKTYYHTGE